MTNNVEATQEVSDHKATPELIEIMNEHRRHEAKAKLAHFKFWDKAMELWPEIINGQWAYNAVTNMIRKENGDDN